MPTLRLMNLTEVSTVARNYSLVIQNNGPDSSTTGTVAN